MRVAKNTQMVGGHRGVIKKGQLFADDSEIVQQYPDLFESPDESAERAHKPSTSEGLSLGLRSRLHRDDSRGAETARQAPGEFRTGGSPGDGEWPCPAEGCQRTFPTEQGVNVHVARSNDEAHTRHKAQQAGQ